MSATASYTQCAHEYNSTFSPRVISHCQHSLEFVTHKSTVGRTVMCRQDGRGRFPVLLDDHSKCRTNSQENPNLVRILYMVCTWNDIYKQYNKLHEH